MSFEHSDESFRRFLQMLYDVLEIADATLRDPRSNVAQEFVVVLLGKFGVNESAHRNALRKDLAHGCGQPVDTIAGCYVAVLGDQARDRHARELVQSRKYRLPDRPADVLEIDVNAVRAGRRELCNEAGLVVIDHCVEAELILHVGALSRATRDPEHAEARRDRHPGWIQFAKTRTIGKHMRSPSSVSEDDVPFGVIGIAGCNHFCDRLTDHYIADLKWFRIGLAVIHPAAHIRIQRKILHAEQNLSGPRRRDPDFLETEVGQSRFAARSSSEDDLPTSSHFHVLAFLGASPTCASVATGLDARSRRWLRAIRARSRTMPTRSWSRGSLLGFPLPERLVAKLLAAHARLVHEAALGGGKDCDALLVFGVSRGPGRQSHGARLSRESERTSFEVGEVVLGLKEDDLGVSLPAELKADGRLREARFPNGPTPIEHDA